MQIIVRYTPEQEQDDELFALCEQGYRYLATCKQNISTKELVLLAHILRTLGYLPEKDVYHSVLQTNITSLGEVNERVRGELLQAVNMVFEESHL